MGEYQNHSKNVFKQKNRPHSTLGAVFNNIVALLVLVFVKKEVIFCRVIRPYFFNILIRFAVVF